MSKRTRALVWTSSACLAVALLGFALALDPHPTSFLDKFPRLEASPDTYRRPNKLLGTEFGTRYFTRRAEFEPVVKDVRRHLPDWQIKEVKGAAVFNGPGGESVIVRQGRSFPLKSLLSDKRPATGVFLAQGVSRPPHITVTESDV